MNLFGDFLEQGVLKLFGEAKPQSATPSVNNANESFAGLGFKKPAIKSSTVNPPTLIKQISHQKQSQGAQVDGVNSLEIFLEGNMTQEQAHIHESLEEKKRRLFKWGYFERVQIPISFIKEKLL